MIEFKKSNSEIEILTKHIDFKDQVIIDVGCGTGKLARLLSKNAKCIYGIDTPELIKQAEEFENPNNVFFKIGLGQSLPIEDNCAGIVLFFASFHHIHEEEMSNAIKESSRVLKQNGIVCFLEPYAQAGSYYDLSRLVDDEAAIQMIAYNKIMAAKDAGFTQTSESFYYLERTFNDFLNLLNIYISNDDRKQDIINKAKQVVAERNNVVGLVKFRSLCRLNILKRIK